MTNPTPNYAEIIQQTASQHYYNGELMDSFMQIITLQNSTFNGCAWVIGVIILLVIAGMSFDEDPAGAIILAICSLFWPVWVLLGMCVSIIAIPVWIGRKINTRLHG